MAGTGTAFSEAVDTINKVEKIVENNIAAMQQYADMAFQKSMQAIDALMSAPPGAVISDESFFIQPPPEIPFDPSDFAEALGLVDFPGPVQPGDVPNPSLVPDYNMSIGAAPVFEPSIDSIQIPPSPGAIDTSGLPTKPPIDMTVTYPAPPNPVYPVMGEMVPIVIPEFIFPEIPPFEATAPEFEGTPINTVLDWVEPVYYTEILDEVMVQIRKYFAGGTGIPAAIEQALFDRAVDRDLDVVYRETATAFDEFSARGFTLPPGALVARVDAIRQEAMLKTQATGREILIKAAEWEIENIRFACQQGIACENVLVNIFLNGAQRMFEAAKYRVESEIAIYNAQVALYNARMQGYQVEATVYKIRLDAELAKLEVFKAQIEGEMAKAQLNEQLVKVYIAELEAVKTHVEIYTAEMQGAKIQSEVIAVQIEAYKVDVEAYAAKMNAEKVKFDAYEAQVQAEAAKVGIIDAEAKAFAATIEGYKVGADVEIQRSKNVIERNRLMIEEFVAKIDKEKARMTGQLGGIQGATARQQALTAAFVAEAETVKNKSQLGVSVTEANARNWLAYMEIQLRKYDAHMTRLLEKAKINIEGLKAAGQISSSLSSGAMAAINTSANLGGGGQVQATESFTASQQIPPP